MGAWTEEMLRVVVVEAAQGALGWTGPLPEGDLAESLDSVQRLTLVVALEDRFEICFDPEDESGVKTMDDVMALLRQKLGMNLG